MNEDDKDPELEEELLRLRNEYYHFCHAMQTGVAWQMDTEPDSAATSPKHLRVGVNSAMVICGALTQLLIDKGIFTQLEYAKAVRDAAKDEADRYTKILSERMGMDVKLY